MTSQRGAIPPPPKRIKASFPKASPSLSPDVVLLIARHLGPVDVARARATCRHWYRLFGRDEIWRRFCTLVNCELKRPNAGTSFQAFRERFWKPTAECRHGCGRYIKKLFCTSERPLFTVLSAHFVGLWTIVTQTHIPKYVRIRIDRDGQPIAWALRLTASGVPHGLYIYQRRRGSEIWAAYGEAFARPITRVRLSYREFFAPYDHIVRHGKPMQDSPLRALLLSE